MNVVLIKLVNGDNIIARVSGDTFDFSDTTLHISDPVIINVMRYSSNGSIVEAHVFAPWVPGSLTPEVKLLTRNIIAMVTINEKITQQYIEFTQRDSYNDYNENTDSYDENEYQEDNEYMDVDEFVDETCSDLYEEDIENDRTPSKRTLH